MCDNSSEICISNHWVTVEYVHYHEVIRYSGKLTRADNLWQQELIEFGNYVTVATRPHTVCEEVKILW